MVGSDIITIVLVLGVGWWLVSTGKLEEIFSGLPGGAGGGGAPAVTSSNGGDGAEASTGGNNVDIAGTGKKCSCSNGKCIGNACEEFGMTGDNVDIGDPLDYVKSKVPGAFS